MNLFKYLKNSRGFSLAELSIALTIIGILASFSLGIGNVYQSEAQLTKTKAKIQLIASALSAYVGANGTLPCPAVISYTTTNALFGKADATTGCSATIQLNGSTIAVGMVPFEDLNLQAEMVIDEWGDKIVYAVTTSLTSTSTFTTAAGSINVEDGFNNAISSTAAYFLFSPGQNLNGAYPRDNATAKTCSSSYLDYANCVFESNNATNTFMDAATHDTSFDDIVNWSTKAMIGTGLSGTLDSRIGSLSPYNICVVNAAGTGIDCSSYKNRISDSGTNVVLGLNALASATSASNNTSIGVSSLYSNSTGVSNVAVGNTALFNNSSGAKNTAIGPGALFDNTTASSNIGIGMNTLYTNSTGSKNIAIGDSALLYNTSGNNVGIGYSSLVSNTTGNFNVGISSEALYSNTTGSNNVSIGWLALHSNTTGNYNIGIGNLALSGNTTSTDNIGIGASALSTVYTGNGHNIAIGQNALNSLTDGTQNIAIGYGALAAINSTLNSTFNNIAIGYNALLRSTKSSNIAIGGSALYNLTTGQSNVVIDCDNSSADMYTGSGNVAVISQGSIGLLNHAISNSVSMGTYLTNNYNNSVLIGNHLQAGNDGDVLIGNGSGTYASFGSGSSGWTFASDKRLKTDIKPIEYGLDSIMSLKPVSFKFKHSQDDKSTYGFIAQEVKEVVPAVVSEGTEKEHYLRIDYNALIPVLTKAIQDLEKQVQSLQAEVNELKHKKK